jgi:uncharacterized protein YjlB
MQVETFTFADDGDIPNSPLPLIVYLRALDLGALDPTTPDLATAFEKLYRSNGWGNGWRNGIFPFHHYHSNAHEFLGIAAGTADVRFGGEGGRTITVGPGDAVLIPAGVGHKRVASTPDLLVIGAYPDGQRADLYREGVADKQHVRSRIAATSRPQRDPIGGATGPQSVLWGS